MIFRILKHGLSFLALFLAFEVHATELTAVYGMVAPAALVSRIPTYYRYSWGSTGSMYGVLFNFYLSSQIFFSTGGLYAPRGFNKTHWNSWQVPVSVHAWVMPSLAVGLGMYYARSLNSVVLAASDYGFLGSVRWRMKVLSFLSMVLEGRYLLGLPNLGSSSNVYARDFQLLGGISIGS